jgi:hypothetical protein
MMFFLFNGFYNENRIFSQIVEGNRKFLHQSDDEAISDEFYKLSRRGDFEFLMDYASDVRHVVFGRVQFESLGRVVAVRQQMSRDNTHRLYDFY